MIAGPFSAVRQLVQLAAAFQQAHVAPADSVIVESPLPGGVAEVVRYLLNTVPPWIQMGGAILAVLVGLALAWLLFVRRRAIRGWLVSRAPLVRIALAAIALVLIAGVGTMGAATWNYTQHSNDFCTGCHVMNLAFSKFSDAGNKHANLSCHDCHQQPLSASARQLYLWVKERPEEIGEHARVPNMVCERCHVTSDTARWQRVAATAGHRVHLESDSSALKDLQCVSCHGLEVHQFRPVAETCGQSGCHESSETSIVLGKMATQTVRHCTSCHGFTAEVPALATRDSARGTLVPGRGECLGCHEMRQVLADFDEGRDPHGGKCGTCHNPHTQKTPSEAAASCATAGCHASWREEPFHVGASHRRVGGLCLTCHLPHAATVDASNCEGCHLSVRARGARRPPLPFDTTQALRRSTPVTSPTPNAPGEHSGLPYSMLAKPARTGGPSPDVSAEPHRSEGDEVPGAAQPGTAHRSRPPPPAAVDSFPHARHATLACLVCHQTGTGHGRLTFEPPRGCAICHHQAPTPTKCASCHQMSEYAAARPVTATVTVPGRAPKPRSIDFVHTTHASRSCLECHTTRVTLAPPAAICQECHSEHHEAGRTCTACHAMADPKAAHTTLEIAHQRCDACHTATSIARLTPTRTFCGTCHAAKATNHYDRRECSVCHFLADPAAYRARLVTPPSR